MTFLPYHYETFVLTQPSLEAIQKIHKVTTTKVLLQNQEGAQYRFSGWVQENRFRISLKISKPNNYIPLVVGKIETTSSGCLVFVSYKLFPVTKMFLIFWSLFITLAGILASYQYQSLLYAVGSLLILVIIHWVTWSNFKIQLKLTRQTLLEVLT
ncbi:MAG TPA: hypothetical protein PKN99_02065 [Cyclobacteriaceae bacterium]|nr:hypothetical protein [Cyclobacteriaceae bacterium]